MLPAALFTCKYIFSIREWALMKYYTIKEGNIHKECNNLENHEILSSEIDSLSNCIYNTILTT